MRKIALGRRQKTSEVATRGRERDWVVAALAGAVTIGALVAGSVLGSVHGPRARPQVIVWSAAVVVLVFGVIATRRVSAGLGRFVSKRTMAAAGGAVRLVTTAAGYVTIICAELDLLSVEIGKVLLGAGVVGVVIGIAAQQSLSNVFASVVLLLAKPFVVGDDIRIRSGAMGGIFDAHVLGVSLTYVTVRTDDGIVKIPNSVMLGTAVGTVTPKAKEQPAPPLPTL